MKLGQNLLFLSIMKSQIINTIAHRLKINQVKSIQLSSNFNSNSNIKDEYVNKM